MCDQKSYEAKPTLIDELTAVKKKYEDLAKEAKIKEMEKVKRKPLSDNSLPLTKEELEEFSKITGLGIILVELIADSIYISYRTETGEEENGYVTDVKAILWLAERFELTSNNWQLENNLTNGGGRPTIQDRWNAQADQWNQWENLSDEEKREFKKLVNKKGEK